MDISPKSLSAEGGNTTRSTQKLKRIVFAFFLLFLFFLPLYEAPKNVFSVLFVFLGGWIAFRQEDAAGRFRSGDLVVWVFFLLAISPFMAGWGSSYMDLPSRLLSALNWALMPLVALVIILVNYSKAHLLWALRSICLGSVIASVEAFVSWSGEYPELNSVGHVNQSALYLAFCLIPAVLLMMHNAYKLDLLLGVGLFLAVFSFQGPALSMVGFGASLAAIGGMWIIYCWNRNYLKLLVGSLVVGLVSFSISVIQPAKVFGPYAGFKQEFDNHLSSKSNLYSKRDKLLNSAIEVAGDSFAGFGIGSFGSATKPPEIRQIVESEGREWAAERWHYFSSAHGHNIFANVLVERGWFGVVSIAIFFLCLLVHFGRNLREEVAQVGILIIAIICLAGLGQSTLHVEHGQLALVCLGLCLVFLEPIAKLHPRRDNLG